VNRVSVIFYLSYLYSAMDKDIALKQGKNARSEGAYTY